MQSIVRQPYLQAHCQNRTSPNTDQSLKKAYTFQAQEKLN